MDKPLEVFKAGGVQASVFLNKVNVRGKEKQIPAVVFQKRYKDKSGEWKSTNHLSVNDVPKAIMALLGAYDYVLDLDLNQEESDDLPEELTQ